MAGKSEKNKKNKEEKATEQDEVCSQNAIRFQKYS